MNGKILREYRIEAVSNWSSFEDYIYREGTLLASVHPTEGTRWFGPDHLGTPRAVFNSAGSVIGLHTYYPFGEEATAATQDTQQMKFTGHERDLLNTPSGTADDTDYLHARQFSLLTGRFHSFDPIGGDPNVPQTWNRFAYALGNPLKYSDPFGLNVSSCDVNLGPCPSWNPPYWEEETITVTGSASPFGPGGSGYAPWLWMLFNGGPRPGSGGGGSGGGWAEGPRKSSDAAEVDPCSLPAVPTGVDIDTDARAVTGMLGFNALALGPGLGVPLTWAEVAASSAPYSAWDFKYWYGGEFAPYGNVHFGAVSNAALIPRGLMLRGAGALQRLIGGTGPGAGNPFGSPPYGDNPDDPPMLNLGYDRSSRCH